MKKRLLAVLLCVIMIMALLPTAFAADATSVLIRSQELTSTNPYYQSSNPVYYEGANNASYMLAQNQENLPSLTVEASPSGRVAINTNVTLTATAVNIEEPFYQWYTSATNSKQGAVLITGASSATYTPSTSTVGTLYYYCLIPDVAESNIVGVTVSQPTSFDDDDDDNNNGSPVTIYNDPSAPDATVWLTGVGLDSSDLLITERNPKGSAYEALTQLADNDDVFATYDIHLRSGRKSVGYPMDLTFDLKARYAGEEFTLVHQKADSTYEYFYDTADTSGDLSFGPLYELSPFMLVKGRLTASSVENPQTGGRSQPSLWLGITFIASAGLTTRLIFARRKRQNG